MLNVSINAFTKEEHFYEAFILTKLTKWLLYFKVENNFNELQYELLQDILCFCCFTLIALYCKQNSKTYASQNFQYYGFTAKIRKNFVKWASSNVLY